MRLVLFGATGAIGRRILREALDRGHSVTAGVRDPGTLDPNHPRLTKVKADATDAGLVTALAAGQDAVLSAVGPTAGEPAAIVVDVAHALVTALPPANVRRLLVVGGAGALDVRPGVRLMDTPDFPAAWQTIAHAHRDALEVYRAADIEWTVVSPAAQIEPGQRTGWYRTGTDQLIVDPQGRSRISMEDYAVAFLDELEKPRFVGKQMTVAY